MSAVRAIACILLILPAVADARAGGQSKPTGVLNESLGASQPDRANTLDMLDEVSDEPPESLKTKCLASFGHRPFCKCIVANVLPGTSFESYVRYNVMPKKDLAYDRASRTKRRAIDSALRARDVCARKFFGVAS